MPRLSATSKKVTRHVLVTTTGLCGATVLFLLCLPGLRPEAAFPQVPGPQTLEEVVQIVQDLGLYCRADTEDGVIRQRLVISERPLSWEYTNSLHLGDMEDPRWIGTVVVKPNWRSARHHFQPEYSVAWGDMFLHGDPALLRQLTSYEPKPRSARPSYETEA